MTKAELQAKVIMLDPSAEYEGLTNAELEKLIKKIEADGDEGQPDSTDGDEGQPDSTDGDEGQPDSTERYAVAEGQAINTLAGLKQSGEELSVQYFVNGSDDLKLLIDAGFVVELA